MLLSIITLNYKTPQKTIACVASVYKQYKKEFIDEKIEHIVVDNSSADDSCEAIEEAIKEKKYKGVRLVKNKTNAGFGAGCNFGATFIKGEYILFFNSDAVIKNKGFIDMVEFLEKSTAGAIIGGQMKNTDGSIQVSAAKFYNLFTTLMLLLSFERVGMFKNTFSKIQKVDWVAGACFMVKRSVFEKLHGFDTNIFMYTEDMEFCFRAKKLGFATYFYPYVDIIHSSHGSSNRSFAIINIYKGILYFYKKHKPSWQYVFVKILLKAKAVILVIIGRVTSNSYLLQTYEKAFTIS